MWYFGTCITEPWHRILWGLYFAHPVRIMLTSLQAAHLSLHFRKVETQQCCTSMKYLLQDALLIERDRKEKRKTASRGNNRTQDFTNSYSICNLLNYLGSCGTSKMNKKSSIMMTFLKVFFSDENVLTQNFFSKILRARSNLMPNLWSGCPWLQPFFCRQRNWPIQLNGTDCKL